MDPFKVLGIEKSATPEEIKRAYRQKAKKYHPDVGGDVWVFQQVQDAYDELMGKRKKKRKAKSSTSKNPESNGAKPGKTAEDPTKHSSQSAAGSGHDDFGFGFDAPPPEPRQPAGRRPKSGSYSYATPNAYRKKKAKRVRRIMPYVIGWGGGGIATLLLGWVVVSYVVPRVWLSEVNKVATANNVSSNKDLERSRLNANPDYVDNNRQRTASPARSDKTAHNPNSDNRESNSNSSDTVEHVLPVANPKTASLDGSGIDHRIPGEQPRFTPTPFGKISPQPANAPFNRIDAILHQIQWAQFLDVPDEITSSIGMRFRLIPPGRFVMGSPTNETGRDEDETQHQVEITRPYFLGVFEVTQNEWYAVMETRPWLNDGQLRDRVREGGNYPATYINWNDAGDFCEKLSVIEGKSFRLPTEAEWEYASRAGTNSAYSFGDDVKQLGDYAWFRDNAWNKNEKYAHEVGKKKSNGFGLHDSLGNVWERCSDWYDEDYYNKSLGRDPLGPEKSDRTVTRGGSFGYEANFLRSANRFNSEGNRYSDSGFRVVQEIVSNEIRSTLSRQIDKNGFDSTLNPTIPAPPLAISPFDDAEARKHQNRWSEHLGMPVEYKNSIGMKFRLIPPGEFIAGSSQSNVDHWVSASRKAKIPKWYIAEIPGETPQRQVTITKPFYMATCEVTQKDFKNVTGKNPASYSTSGEFKSKTRVGRTDQLPIESVTWFDAVRFCNMLSERESQSPYYKIDGKLVEILGGNGYRLPFELEWELACKAGSTSSWSFGDDVIDLKRNAWYRDNSRDRTSTVATLLPNPYGLYDMHGNVWEWCNDWYDENQFKDMVTVNPTGPAKGSRKVLRGGSHHHYAVQARSTFRSSVSPRESSFCWGFRVVRSFETESQD